MEDLGDHGKSKRNRVVEKAGLHDVLLKDLRFQAPTTETKKPILVEMKTTKKPIKDATLAGFFFGATQREYDLAAKLGDRFRFAFVVLNSANIYGKPFAVLLTLQELEHRTRTKRIQYQVNLWSAKEVNLPNSNLVIN